MSKALIIKFGQQYEIDFDWSDAETPSIALQENGYIDGDWYENEIFEVTVGENPTLEARFMFMISTASMTYPLFAYTVLDYADVLARLGAAYPLKIHDRKPDWA